jgi:hypothetical protein
MSDATVKILTSLIGLAGTLSVAYFGYRQWRAGQRTSSRSELLASRRQIYQELWKMVETVHTDLRADPTKHLASLKHHVAQINSYILKNEIYLANGDHALVDSYLQALGEMVNWIQREGDSATKAAMSDTAEIPRDALAVARAYGLRDKLKARIRKVLEES